MRWPRTLAVVLLGASAIVASAVLISATQASAQTGGSQALLVHKKKYVMGSVFEIAAYGDSQTQVSDAIDLLLWPNFKACELYRDAGPEPYPTAAGAQALGVSASQHLLLVAQRRIQIIKRRTHELDGLQHGVEPLAGGS